MIVPGSVGRSLSRRAALTRLGAGGLGAALALPAALARAQTATPAGGQALPPAGARFVAAMEAADADAIAASYLPDGVLEEVGFANILVGRDQIRQDESSFLAGFTQVAITIPHAFATADWAALEFAFAGVYADQVPGMPAGQGQPVTFRGAGILRFNDAGIIRHTQYFDAYGILVQLGALPAPPTASPAA